jgi:3-phenylpropionate/cinnamic acid dioxygenase small subunit
MDADDIVAIEQLLARYTHLLDDHEFDRLGEVFAEDAEADYSSGGVTRVLTGLDKIVAFLSNANASSAHHISNVFVFEREGRVCARTKFFVPYTRPQHHPHRWYGGEYDDVLSRLPDGWRIQRRIVSGRWQLSIEEPDLPAYRRTF